MAVRAVAGLKLVTRHRRGRACRSADPQPAPVERPPRQLGPPRGPPPRRPRTCRSPPTPRGCWASPPPPVGRPRWPGSSASSPPGYPIPILVVQHIAEGFEGGLVHWLGGETAST